MRWCWVLVLLGSMLLIGGCSGGGGGVQPVTAEPDELRITYLAWAITVQTRTEMLYEVSSKLWMPTDAPRFTAPRLDLPAVESSHAMQGPYLLSPTDGTNQDLPIRLYWGTGAEAPKGQPQAVASGAFLPGYTRPGTDLYLYRGQKELENAVTVPGTYTLSDGAGYQRTWTVPADQAMLPPANIVQPMNLVTNALKPIEIVWQEVPGAGGYFVYVTGQLQDTAGNAVRQIVWTSADRPVVYDAIYDYTPYLLPATTRSVTVPANIFRGCKSIEVNVLAHNTPYVDTLSSPKLHLISGSLSTKVYVLYEQQL